MRREKGFSYCYILGRRRGNVSGRPPRRSSGRQEWSADSSPLQSTALANRRRRELAFRRLGRRFVLDAGRSGSLGLLERIVSEDLVLLRLPPMQRRFRSPLRTRNVDPRDGTLQHYIMGADPGISCKSAVDRQRQLDYAVLANTSAGAWPIARAIDDLLGKEE